MDDATVALLAAVEAECEDPTTVRSVLEQLTRRNTRGPEMSRVVRTSVPTTADSATVTAFVPIPRPSGLVLFLDKAPWEGGNAWATASLARRIAERSSCTVVTMDYRVSASDAPSVALAGAEAVAAWSLNEQRALGTRVTDSLVVLGHGTGGLLAAQLMGSPSELPLRVGEWLLVSPNFRPAATPTAGGLPPHTLTAADLERLGDLCDEDPHSAPADVSELVARAQIGLGPVRVHTGELDVTAAPAAAFARELAERGVDAVAMTHNLQINGFFSTTAIPAGERVLQAVVMSIRDSVAAAQAVAATALRQTGQAHG